MNYYLKLLVAVLSLLGLIACTGEPMRIDHIPNSSSLDRSMGRKIVASASGFQLFYALPTNANSRHARALELLRDQAYNESIADVTIRESWSFAVIGMIYTTDIEATAYPRRRW